jgi:hypothetical protein
VSRASRDYALSLLVVATGGALVIVGAVFAGLLLAGAGCVACALTADGAGA